MGKEVQPTPVTGIRIDLVERSITFEGETTVLGKLTLAKSGVVYESSEMPPEGSELAVPAAETKASNGRDRRVVLTGRLKSVPKEGKEDRKGNPTAWAKFAAHQEEEEEGAHMYLATFHRHTTAIALTLSRSDQLTVQGYPHPSDDPDRLDTLSVINILDHPGKDDATR